MPVIARAANDPRHEATRAGLVASQLLGFASCRYVFRLPSVIAMTRAEIVAWLGPTVQRYVAGKKLAT